MSEKLSETSDPMHEKMNENIHQNGVLRSKSSKPWSLLMLKAQDLVPSSEINRGEILATFSRDLFRWIFSIFNWCQMRPLCMSLEYRAAGLSKTELCQQTLWGKSRIDVLGFYHTLVSRGLRVADFCFGLWMKFWWAYIWKKNKVWVQIVVHLFEFL